MCADNRDGIVAPAPQKAELNTCAWLGDLDPDDEGQDTDTYLAVGSNDSLIHIISIARCRVICVLQGPSFHVITTEGLIIAVLLTTTRTALPTQGTRAL